MKNIHLVVLSFLFLISCEPTEFNNVDSKSDSYKNQYSNHTTKLIENDFISDGETPIPPDSLFEIIKYESNVGYLDAYISTNIDTTIKNPILIWAHGGFGGIGSSFWQKGSYIENFINAGFVILCPSWRGENMNPGKFELFFGEVSDLNKSINYASNLEFVDKNRIYLAGHSTGGTLAILASMLNKDLRATFVFGGAPNIEDIVSDGYGYGNTPFDYKNKKESYIRSSINFVSSINNPIFYFEGEDSYYVKDAKLMEEKAEENSILFKAFIIKNQTHFSIVNPINKLISNKIMNDTLTQLNIEFSKEELDRIF